jgi:hypothetical protein
LFEGTELDEETVDGGALEDTAGGATVEVEEALADDEDAITGML